MMDLTLFKPNLKGAIRNYHYEYKYLLLMYFWISSAIYLSQFILNIIFSGKGGYEADGGLLNQGSFIIFVCFGVFVFYISSRKSLKSIMAFPGSRFSLSVANMIMMLFCAFVMMSMLSGFTFLEVLCCRLLSLVSEKFIMVSYLSIRSYSVGLLLSFFYLIVFGSLIYTVLMYIKKWKIQSIIVLSVLIAIPIINRNIAMEFFYFINDVVFPGDEWIVIAFLSFIFLVLHSLAYIPFKQLEVEK